MGPDSEAGWDPEKVVGGFVLFTLYVGEFGVVYRAKLLRKQGRSEPGFVAVKTMRGMLQLGNNQ